MFIECLDYIFYNQFGKDVFELKGVRKLPGREKTAGPLPNGEHPSDHLPIAATFVLPNRVQSELKKRVKATFVPMCRDV